MKLEVWWIDRWNHEAFPKNPMREAPDWASEFVPKKDFDRAIDLLRQLGVDFYKGGALNECPQVSKGASRSG